MTIPGRLIAGVAAALILILGGSALQFRAQREAGRAQIGRLEAALDDSKHDLILLSRANANSNLVDRIADLNAQVVSDQSALLDCWVVIQRLAPNGLLNRRLAIYRVPASHTARATRTLVERCARSALP